MYGINGFGMLLVTGQLNSSMSEGSPRSEINSWAFRKSSCSSDVSVGIRSLILSTTGTRDLSNLLSPILSTSHTPKRTIVRIDLFPVLRSEHDVM